MGQLILPKQFAPGFGNPRVAPDENLVEIDWNHPLAEGLLFYSIGFRDLVSGQIAQPIIEWGSTAEFRSARNFGPRGLELESHSTVNGGFVWEHCTELARLNGQELLTIAASFSFDDNNSTGTLVGLPVDAITWSTPFENVNLHLIESGLKASLRFRIAAGVAVSSSADNALREDGKPEFISFSKNDTTSIEWYVEGEPYSTSITGNNALALVFNNQFNIYALSRNTAGGTGGVNGRMQSHAWWARDLKAGEHRYFYNNPSALLRLRVPTIYYIPAVTGSIAIGTSSETDSAPPLGSALGLGTAFETDAVLSPGIDEGLALVAALETDAAIAVARLLGIGVATESNAAPALSRAEAKPITLAAETDTALLVSTGGQALAISTVLESEVALPLGLALGIGVGQEVDVALALALLEELGIGTVAEVDAAIGLTAAEALAISTVLETDTALGVTIPALAIITGITRIWTARSRGVDWEARSRGTDWEARE